MKRLLPTFLLLVILIIGFLFLVQLTNAGVDIIVNTTDDELNNDGDCSLREAIQSANSDTAVDACAAGAGPDTILLPAGTYTLTLAGSGEDGNLTGDLDISDDLTLMGFDFNTTIVDGGTLDTVFDILSGAQVLIREVTITNGQGNSAPGGVAINVSAQLTLENCSLSGNNATTSGGGAHNQGTLIVDHCLVSANSSDTVGMGIRNSGSLWISDSTINNNLGVGTSRGGGVYNSSGGTVTLERITVSGNTATFGGGIYNTNSTMTLTNVTVSGNTGDYGGGIYNIVGGTKMVLVNSTVVSNTVTQALEAGIDNINGGTIEFLNTIIAHHEYKNCNNNSSTYISNGHNLESDDTCELGATGDITGTSPLLLPLGIYGGPTETHALLPPSPAVDGGDNNGCPSEDQRGFPRPVDGDGDGVPECDIGSFELAPAPPTPTATSTSTATPTATNTPPAPPTPTPTGTPPPPLGLLISEVQYNPGGGVPEPAGEWLEVYNPHTFPVNLAGWEVCDDTDCATAGAAVAGPSSIAPFQFGLLAKDTVVYINNYTLPAGIPLYPVTAMGGSSGLGNAGDRLVLLDLFDRIIDCISYGADTFCGAHAGPAVDPGNSATDSIERCPLTSGGSWLSQPLNNPGQTSCQQPRFVYLPAVFRP